MVANHGSINFNRTLLAVLLGFFIALYNVQVVAAPITIDVGPSDYRSYGPPGATHTPSGIRTAFPQTVTVPSTGNLTVTRNPVIPYGGIVTGMRNFVRVTPGSLAASAVITGLFIAIDWIWDEATGQWVSGYEDQCPPGRQCVISGTHDPSQMCVSNNPDSILNVGESKLVRDGSGNIWEVTIIPSPEPQSPVPSNTLNNCTSRYGGGMYPTNASGRFPILIGDIVDPSYPGTPVITPIPLDESDWSDMTSFLPTVNPAEGAAAGRDGMERMGGPLPGYTDTPITGPSSSLGPSSSSTTSTDTGDVITTTTTTNNYNYGDTTITQNTTTVTNTYQNGNLTSTTTTTTNPAPTPTPVTTPTTTEFPVYCEWAKFACDWMNWTREPLDDPDPDLSGLINDDDFEKEKTFNFGSKACPPDITLNLQSMGTVTISFRWWCELAAIAYYMVMASAYVFAAYISVGVVRG